MARAPAASSVRRSKRRPPARPPVCGYVFDEHRCKKTGNHYCKPRAEKVRCFFEEVLVHTKGRFARTAFVLAPWQWRLIVAPAFGQVRWSTELHRYVRQYRIVWIEIARKNGKSELLAGIALYLLIADDEESAEIYGCAKDVKQARKVWDVAERMVKLSPELAKMLKQGKIKINVQEKKIIYEPKGAYYEVITSDAAGELGHNPHGVVFDEVLTQPGPKLWEALATAMDTREQPMMWAATTAGDNPNSFAASEHEYCLKVDKDPRLDPTRLVFIRNTAEKANVWLEKNWKWANPALGDFKSLDGMRAQAREAKNNPRKENSFRQFHGNQWVKQVIRWIPMDRYDASAQLVVEEQLHGLSCYGALHLAASTDVTSLIWDFPNGDDHQVLCRFWVPKARMEDLNRRTEGAAAVWEREGLLQVTPGDMIDYSAIREQLDRDVGHFIVEELAYHRMGMTELANELEDAGITVTPVTTTMSSMAGPTKELERLIYDGTWHHGGNPILRWMFNNIAIVKDSDENFRIDPKESNDTVVGPVAAVMALKLALLNADDMAESAIY